MRIVLDLQGHQVAFIGVQGVVYRIHIIRDEDGQEFELEGSLGAMRGFFEAGLQLVQDTEEAEGDPDDIMTCFGPHAGEEEEEADVSDIPASQLN